MESLLKNHESHATEVVTLLKEKDAKVLGLFHEYVRVGFYPYFSEYQDVDLFKLTLEQNVRTAIESDLTALHPSLSGGSVARIKRLPAVIAASVPFTPDLAMLRWVLAGGSRSGFSGLCTNTNGQAVWLVRYEARRHGRLKWKR